MEVLYGYTGHEIQDASMVHIGSCICGAYVWHVYRSGHYPDDWYL